MKSIESSESDKPFIQKLIKHIDGEIGSLRVKNDDVKKGEVETSYLRGQIKALQSLKSVLDPKHTIEIPVNVSRG